jgi:hypothetical protein
MSDTQHSGLVAPVTDGEHAAAVAVRAADDSLLSLLKARAKVDDDLLEKHEPFFWTAIISTQEVDSYFTRMGRTTLKNYADDANSEAGVPFMNSHRTGGGFLFFSAPGELPMGRSLQGHFYAGQHQGAVRTEASFYTLSDIQLGQVRTDDFIAGVRSGIVKDVSVGFGGGRYVCSICGGDMLRYRECAHGRGRRLLRLLRGRDGR